MSAPRKTAEQFWASLDRSSGCWVHAGVRADGYVKTTWQRQTVYGHRLAWELARGPIPAEMQVDHLCRNRACCNPDHLEVVTPKVNTVRALPFRTGTKSTCLNGHEFTPENTYRRPSKPEARVCRECKKQTKQRYLSRKAT